MTRTLSQTIRGEVVTLAERTEQLHIRTERLQTQADRKSSNRQPYRNTSKRKHLI